MDKDDRDNVILDIAGEIESLGRGSLKHRFSISAHKLEDWGARLQKLICASREELESLRNEILRGNPAKYQ